MTVLLVRHARAGQRDKWQGDDRLRPLSERGRAQADELVAMLAPWLSSDPVQLLSSPWLRCVSTLEPVAASLGSRVVENASLSEGAGGSAVEAFDRWLRAPGTTVLCTHGDVIDEILEARHVRGPRTAKGSVWVFENGDATYIAPRNSAHGHH